MSPKDFEEMTLPAELLPNSLTLSAGNLRSSKHLSIS